MSNESSEKSSDLSEAEALEEGNMEAEGERAILVFTKTISSLISTCQSQPQLGQSLSDLIFALC